MPRNMCAKVDDDVTMFGSRPIDDDQWQRAALVALLTLD